MHSSVNTPLGEHPAHLTAFADGHVGDAAAADDGNVHRLVHVPNHPHRHGEHRGYNLNREQIRDGAMPINPDGDLSGLRLPTLLSSDTLF